MRTNTTTQLRPAFWHGFLLICIVFTLPISFASKHNRTVRRSVPVRHLAVFNRPIPDAILANLTSDVDGNLTRRAFGRRDNDGSISLSGDILHFGNKTHVLLYPLTEAQIAWLAQHEFVDVVEEDRVVKIQDWKKERKKTSDSSNPIRERIIGADQNYTIVTQNTSSWGLSRIDQRTLPLNNTYNYISLAGRDVDVYVIDTGIQIGHPDFGGRAKWGVTIQGSNDSDDNGHGTFVAGIIGGALYGVAKQCNLIAVKSLDHEGSGTVTDILYGLQYVIEQHLLRNNTKTVINLSLGTEKSRTLNKAVNAAINAGIHITVAAGNGDDQGIGQNACGYSPASANAALTVGATDIQDVIADFSNYGPCVNIFAPGVGVSSDWVGDPNGAPGGKLSGTSFSTPYVTGVVALLLSSSVDDHPMNPKQVKDLVTGLATSGTIRGINMDSPNLLVYNGVQELGTGTSGGFKQTTSPSVYVKIVPVIFWGVSFYSWNHGLS